VVTDDHPDEAWAHEDRADERRPEGGAERPRAVISTTPWEADVRHDAEMQRILAADRRRRRLPWVVVGILAAIAGVIAAAVAVSLDDDEPTRSTDTVTMTTAEVARRDLVEEIDFPAQLAYAGTQEVVSPVAGTVSTIAATGEELARGDVVALLDGEPMVVLYGDQPFERPLAPGDDGADVQQLEANLAALGFDDGGGMAVDGDYTAETARAARAWQSSIGAPATGDVPLGRVVAASGPLAVLDAVARGARVRPGERLALAEVRHRSRDVVQRGPGVVTQVLPPGTPIRHGDVLLDLDDLPVVAVTEPSELITVVLDALAADDLATLESLLVFFGHDPDGLVVIDGQADLATLGAFGRWQIAVGLPETFAVGAPYFVEVPAGMAVDEVHLEEGRAIGAGALAYTVGRPTLSLSAEVTPEEVERFDIGGEVEVVLADGDVREARVAAIAEVPPGGADSIAVTFTVVDPPAQLAAGPATIRLEASRIDGAMVVPSRAVIPLPGGRSGVRIRRADESTELVEVQLGVTQEGFVEIVGGELEVGDVVMFAA
jgi:peptidoglycan hydrolase-like protein with peptidoglycan-binding domain